MIKKKKRNKKRKTARETYRKPGFPILVRKNLHGPAHIGTMVEGDVSATRTRWLLFGLNWSIFVGLGLPNVLMFGSKNNVANLEGRLQPIEASP